MAIYGYDKAYGNAGALHAEIAASSLTGLLGVTWDEESQDEHKLHIEFESELSTDDKATLDSIIANFGS